MKIAVKKFHLHKLVRRVSGLTTRHKLIDSALGFKDCQKRMEKLATTIALNACRTSNYTQRSKLIGLINRYSDMRRNCCKIDRSLKYVTCLFVSLSLTQPHLRRTHNVRYIDDRNVSKSISLDRKNTFTHALDATTSCSTNLHVKLKPFRRAALGYVIKIVNENCSTERVYCRNIDTFIDAINVTPFGRERERDRGGMLVHGHRLLLSITSISKK